MMDMVLQHLLFHGRLAEEIFLEAFPFFFFFFCEYLVGKQDRFFYKDVSGLRVVSLEHLLVVWLFFVVFLLVNVFTFSLNEIKFFS